MTTTPPQNTCACSCGETKGHIVAKRRTADNVGLLGWVDAKGFNLITWDGRSQHRKPLTSAQLWMLLDRADLYNYNELPALIRKVRANKN